MRGQQYHRLMAEVSISIMQKSASQALPLDLSYLRFSLPSLQESVWELPQPQPRSSLRSAAPVFTPRSNAPFQNEREEARKYLVSFRTQRCEGSCTGEQCLHAHFGESLRRPVYLTESGQWNYSSGMCVKPQCSDQQCRAAHTYEERLYHPEVYKVAYCGCAVNENGVCKGFGVHCPFAHSSQEWRGGDISQVPPTQPAPISDTLMSSSPPTKSFSTSSLPKLQMKLAQCQQPEAIETPTKSVLSQLLRSNQKLAEEHCALKTELGHLKGELQKLKHKTMCPQCHVTDKSVILLCGHLLCHSCSQLPAPCPVCLVPARPLCVLKL